MTEREGAWALLVFRLEGQRCGLPVEAVERVLPMAAVTPLPQGPAVALGLLNLHGELLPVLDLRRRFGLPPADYGPGARLLVSWAGARRVLLPVDEVEEVVEIRREAVIPPEAILPGAGRLAGVVALPDGLLLIHDLEGFLSLEEERALGLALQAGGEPA